MGVGCLKKPVSLVPNAFRADADGGREKGGSGRPGGDTPSSPPPPQEQCGSSPLGQLQLLWKPLQRSQEGHLSSPVLTWCSPCSQPPGRPSVQSACPGCARCLQSLVWLPSCRAPRVTASTVSPAAPRKTSQEERGSDNTCLCADPDGAQPSERRSLHRLDALCRGEYVTQALMPRARPPVCPEVGMTSTRHCFTESSALFPDLSAPRRDSGEFQ